MTGAVPQRLSSRLTIPARLLYVGSLAFILGLAIASLFMPPRPGPIELAVTIAFMLGTLLFAPWYLRIFAFRETHLDGEHLVVRGLGRSWRIPIQRTGEIITSTPRGWTMVRVVLDPPVPGLGEYLRILGPFTQHSEFVAGMLEATRSGARPGVR
jgi:hypothetical protein